MVDADKPQLLVIDDDLATISKVKELVGENYQITHSSDISSAVQACKDIEPIIVLLAIDNLADNARSVVDDIHNAGSKRPSVLCLSSSASTETRLSIYKIGGDDFIEKPIIEGELTPKLDKLTQFHKQQRSMEANSQMATQTAMNAMVESSQYGSVLRFFNEMYQASDLEKIKNSFFSLMDQFGLKTSIQFRAEGIQTFDSTGKDPRPIELQVYEKMSNDGRLISFSSRLMVNGMFASFIVKNMPVDDEITTGRFQDILAVIIEGLDSKLTDLQRLGLLRQTATEVAASSDRLSDVMQKHEQFIVNAMNHVIGEINSSFDTLELTEPQEEFFTQLTESVLNSVEESFIYIGNEQDVLNCLGLSLRTVLGQKP